MEKKKVAIKVESEQEFNALMKYYEEVKEWVWSDGSNPVGGLEWYEFEKSNKLIVLSNKFFYDLHPTSAYTIIPFSHLAAIEGIDIEEKPETIKEEILKEIDKRRKIYIDKEQKAISKRDYKNAAFFNTKQETLLEAQIIVEKLF